MPALHTIGHSNHSIARFVELLREQGMEVVADVRSMPASRRHPQFNRAALAATLAQHGIEYRFLGRELGARRAEREAYDGKLASYERIARLPAFREGLALVQEDARHRRLTLMCAERDPLDCHRTLLVCRHLRESMPEGIRHVLGDGATLTHEALERRLVLDMGTGADQPDLFAGAAASPLEQAYNKRGLAIAYREK